MKRSLVQLNQNLLKALKPYLRYFFKCTYPKEEPEKKFHIIGVDVIFDKDLKPWLLEINANPSMSVAPADNSTKEVSDLDYYVKSM